ncbi:MAG: hypothetical protein B6229_04790 [Spirochaetaceae bacterium 4572_7]|nr:MAG: hypothetical protein B6229_04790 [Spirochaetaceae bacterium 4572_7]
MFTLSKIEPKLSLSIGSCRDLIAIAKEYGGRSLLICSPIEDRKAIELVKEQLKINKIIFIQENHINGHLNTDTLNKIVSRSKDFNLDSIISLGDFNQRMSGRFISEALNIPCFELPTIPSNPLLLYPKAIYSNRVGDDFATIHLNTERIKGIAIDPPLQRESTPMELLLSALAILQDLAQLFTLENNPIATLGSRTLFNQLLLDIEGDKLTLESLILYGTSASFYHAASKDIELHLTIYSWLLEYRFKYSYKLAIPKLLPWLLDNRQEPELATRVREILSNKKLDGRLVELGFSLEQLLSIVGHSTNIIDIIEKAF